MFHHHVVTFDRLQQSLPLQVLVRLLVIHIAFRILEFFRPLSLVLLLSTFTLETISERHGIRNFGDLVEMLRVGQSERSHTERVS